MDTTENADITVKTVVYAPIEEVWNIWTSPDHIIKWNNASDDWHTPAAENDLREGGKFVYRMEAKDGSAAFAFSGIYEEVVPQSRIVYKLEDDRVVSVSFEEANDGVTVSEIFTPEKVNSIELQQSGWQSILDNFKNYTEGLAKRVE
ncbi:MAG: Activator of Hsp90 ATPase 1 family protein [Pedobacter sp.]|jgi:uncharacterized protein YndB with AHSA1/START domain|nr:Activator of Hsp90 ATPase 1 family protein [Pedobacter sp.]